MGSKKPVPGGLEFGQANYFKRATVHLVMKVFHNNIFSLL